jgi:dTDP-4-dehydrorhamnose 3,5-epimerase
MPVQITDMSSEQTAIEGLLVFTMKQVHEDRGVVREFFRDSAYPRLGGWRQINVTESRHGAVRGLHGEAMTKLVSCVAGEAFGAYLDARPESASYGAVVTVDLSPGTQVLVPPGVCNGFQSVSPQGTQYLYCFTEEWVPGMAGVAFSPLDESLGIDWPVTIDVDDPAQISAKDAGAPKFGELAKQGAAEQRAGR